MAEAENNREWTFLTNHLHVLLVISSRGEVVLREVANLVGITERAVQKIVMELEDAGYLIRERVGRVNRYTVDLNRPLRHPLEKQHTVGALIRILQKK
jgi:DNA-binding MarR family transcriptional regulator